MSKKMAYVVMGSDEMRGDRLARSMVFTDRAAADFAMNGARMFQDKGDHRTFFVQTLELMEGDTEDFLATGGLGPKARKNAG